MSSGWTLTPSVNKEVVTRCLSWIICNVVLSVNIWNEFSPPIQQHVWTRLTSPSDAMNSDPRYISHCYDVMENMAATHNDTRLIIKRGLTVGEDKYGSLEVKGKSDSN